MGVPQRPVRKIRVKSVFTQSLQCVDCPCFQAFVFISPQKSCFITQVSGSSCNSGVITSSVKPRVGQESSVSIALIEELGGLRG